MIDEFLKQLFLVKTYSLELIALYVLSGILAGLTRLTIKDGVKAQFKGWWSDGSLLGAMIVSVAGALLFDNNFLWSFLGGYFIVYVLEFIQKALEKASRKKEEKQNGTA
jgi:hypothetical protein